MADAQKKAIIGEFLASFTASLFGLGLVFPLSVLGVITTLTEFSIWFGVVYAIVIVAFGPISGAHCNTGITLAFASVGLFDKKMVAPYLIAQVLGWGLGVVPMYFIFNGTIDAVAPVISELGVNPTAIVGCGYVPGNELCAFGVEFFATFFLTWAVFLLLDPRFPGRVPDQLFAVAIGAVIACSIMFCVGVSGGCLNAARDLGTRIVNLLYGLITGKDVTGLFSSFQWVLFLIAPTLGSIAAAFWQTKVIAGLLPEAPAAEEAPVEE